MRNGKYAEACPKLADSKSLDPGAGTILNLAFCYEKLGKRARAWTEYQSAAVAARDADKPEWERAAKTRASMLESRLAWVVVHLARGADATDANGLDIRLDGAAFEVALLEHTTPVDPGTHDLQVSAAGRRPWSSTFEVDERQVPTIEIPPLEPLPAIPPAAAPVPAKTQAPVSAPIASQRGGLGPRGVAAIAMAGVGVAALGVAAGFGVAADATYRGAECDSAGCTPAGRLTQARGFDQAALATASATTGLSALTGAALLWWLAPPRSRTIRVEPTAGKAALGMALEGEW
jgi:hypothetical protein